MESGAAAERPAPGPSGSRNRRIAWRVWAVVPLLLLVGVVAIFASSGGSLVDLVGTNPPPPDQVQIGRVEFRPGEIRVHVRNPQPDAITVASVTVDDAIVPFETDGPRTIGRLDSTTVVIPFAWVADDPYLIGVTSSSGIETVKEIPAAVETKDPGASSWLGYALIGLLVGIVPVALGLAWLPSLRHVNERLLASFMAMTAGLLTFLAVDALAEALELQAALRERGAPQLYSHQAQAFAAAHGVFTIAAATMMRAVKAVNTSHLLYTENCCVPCSHQQKVIPSQGFGVQGAEGPIRAPLLLSSSAPRSCR